MIYNTIQKTIVFSNYDINSMSKKTIIRNKKAFFDYTMLYTLEAGIVLRGDEVKSLRQHKGSLNGSFAVPQKNELFLINCMIPTYTNAYTKDEALEKRSRKLLLHSSEIMKIIGDISRKGITIIPLEVYFNEKNKVKVALGIARHKKSEDKREVLKERDIARDTRRELKNYNK